jgi:hypothetical protein
MFNTKIYSFSTKYLHFYSYSKEHVFTNVLNFLETPTIGQSPNHHQHEEQKKIEQEFKI